MRNIFSRACLTAALFGAALGASPPGEYRRRVEAVRRIPGLVAFWDFVRRDGGRFAAWQPPGDHHDFRLDAANYVRDYWGEGREASYADFLLAGQGPFGQAVRFRAETDPSFRPLLLVPRARLHDSGLDAKGPGRSVSMAVWLLHEGGNHAIAGIWHEGTDLRTAPSPARRVEPGRRQYALFAGLAANEGAVAAHVSENGGASFGDRYARNLAVTPEKMPAGRWCAAAFSFDARRGTVTAYLDGKADDYWIEHPENHPFYQWAAKAWLQAELRRQPGIQPGEETDFPAAQFYRPPETHPLSRKVVERRGSERVELRVYRYTKVRETLRKDRREPLKRELVALRANPFWFGHNLYAPPTAAEGGPFTIGRVIHSGRSVGWTGLVGGVAVFDRALPASRMRRLAAAGREPIPPPE
ncbi:MAG: hypothetical protein LC126_20335 [Bryobacterales bacterium]|nr:hypothetical protein [Bryobacterales bacterium]